MNSDIETQYDQWHADITRIRDLGKVFVIGCAKSGTTWLADLLNSHEQIVVRGEGGFAWRLIPALAQAFRAFNDHQKSMDPITLLSDEQLLLTTRTLIDSQLARYVYESRREPSAIRIVGDKTPQHTVCMPMLDQLYPECKFIHIIRDPRDTATSAWFHFGKTDPRNLEEYIEYYITQVWPVNVSNARQTGQTLAGRYREVRYEDLKSDAAGRLKTLLEFLGVNADDEVVKKCVDAASFEKKTGGRRAGQTDSKSFYRSGTTGDWRNRLPIEPTRRACQKIAPLMTACGYEPEC